jgi:glycosyltransferase involved in cell wall biosynthesis
MDYGGHIVCGNDTGGILAGTRICMVVYSYYPKDQRVRREAETLKEDGANVHVICLRNENEMRFDIHNKISIYRIPLERRRNKSYLAYFLRYFLFLFLSTALLTRLFIKYKYKVVHIHSIPDYEVFCAFVPKLFGAKIILDLHESLPEVLATKFDLSMDSKKVYVAKIVEKASVRFADLAISTSDIRKKILKERTQKKDVAVIMNLPKRDIFKRRDMTEFIKENGLEESFIVSYMGGLNPERELEVVIEAIKYIEKKISNIAFIFCGTGEREYIATLRNLIKDLNLEKKVLFMGYVPQEDVLNYVAVSNVSLSPYKIHPNLNPVGSTKVFEYLLVPKPVIVADYSGNREEFEDLGLFYKSSDHKSLGEKIFEVYENEEEFKKMARRAQEVIFKRYNPKKNEEKLLGIYKNLLIK